MVFCVLTFILVACCGLPEPNPKHALVMARFAQDCARRVSTVLRKLETTLGPETTSLGFRFGLHSGPTTGGVLRGQRARFQLFGDVSAWQRRDGRC